MNQNTKKILRIVAVMLVIGCAFSIFLSIAKIQKLAGFPFKLEYRKALTGNGYVDQIVNTSDKSQSVKVTLNNPTLNRTKVYSMIVDAHRFKEIGYLEGWASSSGDKITLEWNGVAKVFTIP